MSGGRTGSDPAPVGALTPLRHAAQPKKARSFPEAVPRGPRELYEPACCLRHHLVKTLSWRRPNRTGFVTPIRRSGDVRAVPRCRSVSAGLLAVKAKPLRGGLRPALTAPAPSGLGSYARNREKTGQLINHRYSYRLALFKIKAILPGYSSGYRRRKSWPASLFSSMTLTGQRVLKQSPIPSTDRSMKLTCPRTMPRDSTTR